MPGLFTQRTFTLVPSSVAFAYNMPLNTHIINAIQNKHALQLSKLIVGDLERVPPKDRLPIEDVEGVLEWISANTAAVKDAQTNCEIFSSLPADPPTYPISPPSSVLQHIAQHSQLECRFLHHCRERRSLPSVSLPWTTYVFICLSDKSTTAKRKRSC